MIDRPGTEGESPPRLLVWVVGVVGAAFAAVGTLLVAGSGDYRPLGFILLIGGLSGVSLSAVVLRATRAPSVNPAVNVAQVPSSTVPRVSSMTIPLIGAAAFFITGLLIEDVVVGIVGAVAGFVFGYIAQVPLGKRQPKTKHRR